MGIQSAYEEAGVTVQYGGSTGSCDIRQCDEEPVVASKKINYSKDVAIETWPLATTGGHTWDAAKRLFEFFERIDVLKIVEGTQDEIKLLELGSGCGWLSLNVADNARTRAGDNLT